MKKKCKGKIIARVNSQSSEEMELRETCNSFEKAEPATWGPVSGEWLDAINYITVTRGNVMLLLQ